MPLACSSTEESAEEAAVVRQIDAAREYETFEVPWLGREFEGMPLASIDLPGEQRERAGEHGPRGPAVFLTYGECDEEDPGSGCTYELEVAADTKYSRGRGAYPRRRIGSVPARIDRGDQEVILFGKGLTITMWGDRFRQVLRAARALRGINSAPGDPPFVTGYGARRLEGR